MATSKGLLGCEATFNYNTGTFSSPTLAGATAVSDLSMTSTYDKAEASSRYTRGKLYLKALVEIAITGKLRSGTTADTIYQDFVTAHLTPDATINVIPLNGASTLNGAWGWMFDAQVFKFGGDQGLGVVEYDDFEIAPAATGNAVQFAQVASGSISYTAI